tara:strand:+ start:1050 stop:1550 length:501 start_codon:yes stop_codon:yes gene_type:complete
MLNFDTLFLDRDGVINKKLQGKYVRHFSEFEFIPGALDALAKLTKVFNRIIIITNQQGIGKKIMSDSDLNILHVRMEQEIEKSEGKISRIYYCPHLQEINCLCRKPEPGMILQAIIDFPSIVIKDSYLIGDSDTDIAAGQRINLNTIKVDNNYTLAECTSDLLSTL